MGSQCPLPAGGFDYFHRLGVHTRKDRPHVFFGDVQAKNGQLPEAGPRIHHSVFEALNPVDGAVTVEADRVSLQNLVNMFAIEVSTTDKYEGDTAPSTVSGIPVSAI